jgi:hypothetical protein
MLDQVGVEREIELTCFANSIPAHKRADLTVAFD